MSYELDYEARLDQFHADFLAERQSIEDIILAKNGYVSYRHPDEGPKPKSIKRIVGNALAAGVLTAGAMMLSHEIHEQPPHPIQIQYDHPEDGPTISV